MAYLDRILKAIRVEETVQLDEAARRLLADGHRGSDHRFEVITCEDPYTGLVKCFCGAMEFAWKQ